MSNVTAANRRAETYSADEQDIMAGKDGPEVDERPTRDTTPAPRPVPAARQPALSAFNIEDNLRQKSEIKILRAQLRQTQNEYRNEQELVMQLKRRVNSAERTRMDESCKINQEAVTLQTSTAKLRSQVEQCRADKQAIEFELAKIKRDVINERRMSADREQRLAQQTDALRDQIKHQDRHVQELGHQLVTMKQIMATNQEKNDLAMDEKLKESDVLKSELEYVVSERNRLEVTVQEKENQLDDAKERINDYEEQLRHQTDIIRKQMTELALSKDRENTINNEMETAQEKLRLLEESVEAERAAHLESKFNSEIVQLKVKDLEGALESEKTTCTETSTNYDQLNKQYNDILRQFRQLEAETANSREQYSQLQNEYQTVRIQLTNELEDKKSVICNLSDQLALHQSNFETLKDELQNAKRRQTNLEETYGSSMRELEMLLENFNVEDGGKLDSNISPSIVLENLRRTLMQYRKNLNQTSEELAKMKKHYEILAKECDSYRDMIWTKDKALEETQRGYTQATKDLNRLRGQFVECEAQQVDMKARLQAAIHERDREVENAANLTEEVQKLQRKVRMDEDEHVNYLHSVYQRIVMGRQVSEPKTTVLASYKWQDLSLMVNEQISSMIGNLNRTDEKIKQLEISSKHKEEMIQQMQQGHDQQLDKLEKLSSERELTWQKQKSDMEHHYSKLLSEVHIRSKKSQSLADQAWERVRATGSVQQGLEGECLNLMNSLDKMKQEQQALVCACALLAGAFFPLYNRYASLSTQHKLMDEQADQASCIYGQARLLVDTLQAELNQSSSRINPIQNRPGLVKFRVGVITVIAANRFRTCRIAKAKMFTSYDLSAGLSGLPVWCGGVVRSVETRPVKDNSNGQKCALSWLTDNTLKKTIMASTTDLQDVLSHVAKQGAAIDNKLLVGAARTSFAKLIEQLSHHYPDVDTIARRDKTSLVSQLGKGLQKMIVDGDRSTKEYYSPPQQVMNKLQQYVLDLAKRLHDSEVHKRHLTQQLLLLENESQHLKGEVNHAQNLHSELNQLKNQADTMVEANRFHQVCSELNEALAREQHAQKLLTKQAKQIEEITIKLDCFMGEDKESRKHLSETIQSLSQAKLDLRHKEQQIRQLSKNLSQLETDNADLLTNIRDAEQALRTTTRDRETLCNYMKSVESLLETAKRNLSVTSRLRPSQCMEDLIALMPPSDQGKIGPESLTCQRLVTAFVDVNQQLLSRLVTMESEIQLQKTHIMTLKQELANACERVSGPYDCLAAEIKTRETADGRDRDDFAPLALDPETPRSDEAVPAPQQTKPKRLSKTRNLKPVKLDGHR